MNHRLLMLATGTLLFSAAGNGPSWATWMSLCRYLRKFWGTAKSAAAQPAVQPCSRCCIYQNQNYSEGAVLKVEGETLQCVRDPNVIGTNPLVWVRLKK
ncbi:Protein of uncharacterised function (DUF1496) [Serratia grimesii]|nr:Protein of uncharacterised function (DUF1496) [Serratia grimesii]